MAAVPCLVVNPALVVQGVLTVGVGLSQGLAAQAPLFALMSTGNVHGGNGGDAPVRPHGIDLEALRPTGTVAAHAAERPYINLPHTIRNIIESGTPRPDPGGVPGALRWDVPGSFRGSEGTFELAIDLATNRILHFLFRSGRR